MAAVVLAALVLASVTGLASLKSLDAGRDEELSQILSAPGVVEKFRENQAGRAPTGQGAISALEAQAQQLAEFLSPPVVVKPPEERRGPSGRGSLIPSPPSGGTARFDLLGTSYSPAGQQDCFAYIEMHDGKTSRWIRTGDVIGQLTVKEIRRDSIICWDGTSEVPMFVPNRPSTSSFLETGVSAVTASGPGVRPSAGDRITGSARTRRTTVSDVTAGRSTVPVSPGIDSERYNALVEQIKRRGTNPETVNKLMEEFRAARAEAQQAEAAAGAAEPNGPVISPLQGRPTGGRRLSIPR
ncbi:MAG: hypothetical protein JW993_06230 [Sedimentisphaerales bacterium]|nr:hypothetical protein [Sedimentisphaerales bacterium]